MSRQIDLTKPLSDEDRQYLTDRDRWRDIATADGAEAASVLPDDSIAGAFGQHPDAVPANAGAAPTDDAGNPLPPEGSADASADQDADNYDDDSAWSYEDLKDEVRERKEAGADDAPALNSSREDLIAWLRSNDEANA